jgi:protein-S-isoprenylcysteine O-methyltransferase Ste14
MSRLKLAYRGAIFLYFIMGLEILIMISPFAAFFYAAFNPFLLALASYPATRWLAAFYLPHMVVPPGLFLQTLRVAGSALLLGGAAVFLVCAAQVYSNKLLKRGVASGGLYSIIRHPQYVGLVVCGIGLSILWPRFLVVALWSVMLGLYYLLARDEEKRMLAQNGNGYKSYMESTGMFLPRRLERMFAGISRLRMGRAAAPVVFAVLVLATVGAAFALRAYTVHALPKWTQGNVTVLPILAGEEAILEHRMADVLEMPEIKRRLEVRSGAFLVYFMHTDYIMQGMIADTGGEWRLYMQHKTLSMIWDWVLHPIGHLGGGHHMMHMAAGNVDTGDSVVRRMIFLRVENGRDPTETPGVFDINAQREPAFVVDVDMHQLALKEIRDLPVETGWGKVPTPLF